MKKRIFALVSAVVIIAIMVITQQNRGTAITGTGTADGFGGKDAITVTISLKDGKIASVNAQGPKETDGIGSVAIQKMPEEMIRTNTINVDGVTGATVSSTGILKAAALLLLCVPSFAAETQELAADYVTRIQQEISTDIVIIGAGGAGMVAAITAADAGKKVVLVEKQAMVGGNSVRASGGMNAAHTPEQASNKFTESAGVEKTLATAASKWADNPTITALADTVKTKWEAKAILTA